MLQFHPALVDIVIIVIVIIDIVLVIIITMAVAVAVAVLDCQGGQLDLLLVDLLLYLVS